MTPAGAIRRLHVSLPEEALEELRRRYPNRRDATVFRDAVAQLLDPSAHILHLPEALRSALADYAAARSQSLDRAAVSLLWDALALVPASEAISQQLPLATFALIRHLILLAVGNDETREAEIVAQAEEWSRQQLEGPSQPT